jgi:hypothetical protein
MPKYINETCAGVNPVAAWGARSSKTLIASFLVGSTS